MQFDNLTINKLLIIYSIEQLIKFLLFLQLYKTSNGYDITQLSLPPFTASMVNWVQDDSFYFYDGMEVCITLKPCMLHY
jgi:hypothetical protein